MVQPELERYAGRGHEREHQSDRVLRALWVLQRHMDPRRVDQLESDTDTQLRVRGCGFRGQRGFFDEEFVASCQRVRGEG